LSWINEPEWERHLVYEPDTLVKLPWSLLTEGLGGPIRTSLWRIARQLHPFGERPISVCPLSWSHAEVIITVMDYLDKYHQLGRNSQWLDKTLWNIKTRFGACAWKIKTYKQLLPFRARRIIFVRSLARRSSSNHLRGTRGHTETAVCSVSKTSQSKKHLKLIVEKQRFKLAMVFLLLSKRVQQNHCEKSIIKSTNYVWHIIEKCANLIFTICKLFTSS
jgi:hypothetical protein